MFYTPAVEPHVTTSVRDLPGPGQARSVIPLEMDRDDSRHSYHDDFPHSRHSHHESGEDEDDADVEEPAAVLLRLQATAAVRVVPTSTSTSWALSKALPRTRPTTATAVTKEDEVAKDKLVSREVSAKMPDSLFGLKTS